MRPFEDPLELRERCVAGVTGDFEWSVELQKPFDRVCCNVKRDPVGVVPIYSEGPRQFGETRQRWDGGSA